MDESLEQAEFWDRRADAWARHADAMEGFARQFGAPAIELLDPAPGQHLADVGCGPGTTSVALAERLRPNGSVTGVDVSARMIETAVARAAGADNVQFKVGDPGTGPIGSFDGIHSRFGVMFFEDPVAAFTNLCRSIRPGGRFVAVVWAELDANPWMFLPTMFAAGPLDADLALPGPGEPGPFSLADSQQTAELLESSGFDRVELTRHEGAWTFAAAEATESIEQLLSVGALGEAWTSATDEARADAIEAVRAGCGDYRDGTGWRLPATALVVSAAVR